MARTTPTRPRTIAAEPAKPRAVAPRSAKPARVPAVGKQAGRRGTGVDAKAAAAASRAAIRRIVAAIRAVPRGQVAGYGVIARRAGLPGRARLVARVLSGNDDATLPWHRILRSDGRIAFPPVDAAFAEQVQRLRAEGVDVAAGRVRMPKGDGDDLDAQLWAPPRR